MKRTVLILSGAILVAAPGSSQEASKPAPESKPVGETRPAPSASPAAPSSAATERAGGQAADAGKVRHPKGLKMFSGEFRAVDLDKKTLTFETEDGKSYTVAAQTPPEQDTLDRAAKLAEVLKPGDKIRMLCRINEKEEPILILSLHMTSDTAPMQYR
jgi:hypothetical protein